MALFDNLKEKVTDLAQSGAAKTKQVAEIAKLKASNLAEEDAIKKAYIELGKLYYAEKGAAPDAAYADLCEKVTAAKANIAANKERLEELKKSGAPAEECDAAVVEVDAAEAPADCGCNCSGGETEAPAAEETTDCGCGCGEAAQEESTDCGCGCGCGTEE